MMCLKPEQMDVHLLEFASAKMKGESQFLIRVLTRLVDHSTEVYREDAVYGLVQKAREFGYSAWQKVPLYLVEEAFLLARLLISIDCSFPRRQNHRVSGLPERRDRS